MSLGSGTNPLSPFALEKRRTSTFSSLEPVPGPRPSLWASSAINRDPSTSSSRAPPLLKRSGPFLKYRATARDREEAATVGEHARGRDHHEETDSDPDDAVKDGDEHDHGGIIWGDDDDDHDEDGVRVLGARRSRGQCQHSRSPHHHHEKWHTETSPHQDNQGRVRFPSHEKRPGSFPSSSPHASPSPDEEEEVDELRSSSSDDDNDDSTSRRRHRRQRSRSLSSESRSRLSHSESMDDGKSKQLNSISRVTRVRTSSK